MIHFARTAAIVVACVALGTTTWAEESEDVQQVRDLLNTEFDGHGKGDPDQIVSCYSPDIVFYWPLGGEVRQTGASDWPVWMNSGLTTRQVPLTSPLGLPSIPNLTKAMRYAISM